MLKLLVKLFALNRVSEGRSSVMCEVSPSKSVVLCVPGSLCSSLVMRDQNDTAYSYNS